MPHIKPNPPRPPPRDENQQDNRAFNNLARAINELTEWLKANHAAVTKQDLEAATAKIIKAIGKPDGITPGIEAAYAKVQMALDRLDAQVPDR